MCYNGKNNETLKNFGPIFKSFLSSNYFLQLENMKEELLVIAYQQRCGEIVLKFCTNRPSRSERRLASSASKVFCSLRNIYDCDLRR